MKKLTDKHGNILEVDNMVRFLDDGNLGKVKIDENDRLYIHEVAFSSKFGNYYGDDIDPGEIELVGE